MIKYLLVLAGIIPSALAQIFLKKASFYELKTINWFLFVGLSGFSYFLSFVLYFFILKNFPISKVSPVMTICVMLIVVTFGFFIGEKITVKHILGIVLGLSSVYLILFN
ncbi:MAG TPA: EamA family transporter [Spirochaetota bacterium]|nr:EamA family transporter [Spirochaetota bacterium]